MTDLLTGIPAAWTPDDTERFLSTQPLPADFLWPHRDPKPDGSENLAAVLPSYRIHKGYGFWLRTTPYFPGLFEAIHAALLACGDELPTADDLAAKLTADRAAVPVQPPLFQT